MLNVKCSLAILVPILDYLYSREIIHVQSLTGSTVTSIITFQQKQCIHNISSSSSQLQVSSCVFKQLHAACLRHS